MRPASCCWPRRPRPKARPTTVRHREDRAVEGRGRTMEITTPSALLRDWRPEDAASLARHADSPRIAATMRDAFPSPYTLEDAHRFIAAATGSRREPLPRDRGGRRGRRRHRRPPARRRVPPDGRDRVLARRVLARAGGSRRTRSARSSRSRSTGSRSCGSRPGSSRTTRPRCGSSRRAASSARPCTQRRSGRTAGSSTRSCTSASAGRTLTAADGARGL